MTFRARKGEFSGSFARFCKKSVKFLALSLYCAKVRTALGDGVAEAPATGSHSLICSRKRADARNRTMKGRMNQMNFVTPSGFRDVLTDEAVLREQAAQAVQANMAAKGYLPVETDRKSVV